MTVAQLSDIRDNDTQSKHLAWGGMAVMLCLISLVASPVQGSDRDSLASQPASSQPSVASSAASAQPQAHSEQSPRDTAALVQQTAQQPVFNLSSYSDQQIGALLQQWPTLSAAQRRDLLAEVRKRMRTADESASTPLVTQRGPSLTLRIQRAKTQHGYGRPTPRQSDAASAPEQERPGVSREGAPELVIRATVTRTLPDGRVVTTKETLRPQVVTERVAANLRASEPKNTNSQAARNGSLPTNGEVQSVGDEAQSQGGETRSKVTVVRAKVRFGAGFDRRQRLAPTDETTVGMRTVGSVDNGQAVESTQER